MKTRTENTSKQSIHKILEPARVPVMLRKDIVDHIEAFSKITGVATVDFIEAYLEAMMRDALDSDQRGLCGTPDLMLTGWSFDDEERATLEKHCKQEVHRMQSDMKMAATVAG